MVIKFRELWALTQQYVKEYLNTCPKCGAPISDGIYHMWTNTTHVHVRLRCDTPKEEDAHFEWVQISIKGLYNLLPPEDEQEHTKGIEVGAHA